MDNKNSNNTFLRSDKMWAEYQKAPLRGAAECFLCQPQQLEVVAEFGYWFIVKNQYPYDAVAEVHEMLFPKRHFAEERDANEAEAAEVLSILRHLNQSEDYDCIIKNFMNGRSHRSHFHYHLIRWKHH